MPFPHILTGLFPTAMLTVREGGMAEAQREENNKRATRRFALHLPVSVRYGEEGTEREAQTRDVSARGVCFYMDSVIQAGSDIDFTLTLPPEITLTESIRVRCKGHVLRVESAPNNGKLAVAAVIEEYEFLADS
jgi:PilZ domain